MELWQLDTKFDCKAIDNHSKIKHFTSKDIGYALVKNIVYFNQDKYLPSNFSANWLNPGKR